MFRVILAVSVAGVDSTPPSGADVDSTSEANSLLDDGDGDGDGGRDGDEGGSPLDDGDGDGGDGHGDADALCDMVNTKQLTPNRTSIHLHITQPRLPEKLRYHLPVMKWSYNKQEYVPEKQLRDKQARSIERIPTSATPLVDIAIYSNMMQAPEVIKHARDPHGCCHATPCGSET